MSHYIVNTYIQHCKSIPFHFKGMSILNAEKFTSFNIATVDDVKPELVPAGAVAVLWIWSKYAPRDSAGWRSTGRHCYLDSTGHRINTGEITTQFETCADAWLAYVRAQNEQEDIIFEQEMRSIILEEMKMARPL